MDGDGITLALLGDDLTDGLEIGLAFDIAHGAADFADDHVHTGRVHGMDGGA